ncbi:MAG: XdhC family protein [Actinobacteria bacterium]|nr:XdhC family protein [Actinomycetota bacterium]
MAEGSRVVAARLVAAEGSSPFEEGATMLVDDRGRIEGSVTGGCVEGALFEEASAVLRGEPPRLRTFGVSDSQAVGVGLMCGGTVHVFIHEIRPEDREALELAERAIEANRPALIATLIDGEAAGTQVVLVDDSLVGSFGVAARLDEAVEREARGCVAHAVSALRSYGAEGEVMGSDLRVFLHAFATPASMIIFGAIDFSAAVAILGRQLGYEVTICDARRPFTEASRFAAADHVVVDWPESFLADRSLDERDVVLVFTHDPKFDEPALIAALATDAGYIGALGSRKTHADRTRRLREAGVEEAQLARISSPCGLDVGARTPEETAVSIVGEILASAAGRSGGPLAETEAPIHASKELPANLA